MFFKLCGLLVVFFQRRASIHFWQRRDIVHRRAETMLPHLGEGIQFLAHQHTRYSLLQSNESQETTCSDCGRDSNIQKAKKCRSPRLAWFFHARQESHRRADHWQCHWCPLRCSWHHCKCSDMDRQVPWREPCHPWSSRCKISPCRVFSSTQTI